MRYNHNLANITTYSGINYNVEHCQRALLKFPEDSKEYAFFFKIWVQLAQKLSTLNYEGEIINI